MMTPQEVTRATFAKAVVGGYNMAAVDAFLDKLTEDYSALYKENGALKGKMKVLVEKMEEYRQVEDSMRGALLAAQKMANEMVAEAEGKRDTILAEAERTQKSLTAEAEKAAKARMEELRQAVARLEQQQRDAAAETDRLIAAEAERLNQAKSATADFVAACRALCQGHLTLLDRVPDLTLEEVRCPESATQGPEEPAEPLKEEKEDLTAQAEEIADQVEEDAAQTDDEAEDVMKAIAALTREDPEPATQEDPWEDNDLGATRVIKLDQLQFGRNYKNGED